jgi:saccharopine dehydrogenase-like NADP-dependent oxidoreductase
MNAVQLGCGICGLVCAEQLAKNPKVDHVILADARTDAAEALADRLQNEKVSVKKVNGTDPTDLSSLLKDCDIVVASMPWRLNKLVMEVAARMGTNYVDFGMPLDGTGPEFDRLAKICSDAGITALVGMGMDPGLSDVFAMHGANGLDTVDEAHVYDGDSGIIEGLDFFSLWSPVDLIDETSVPAAVFRNGETVFIPPLSESEVYDFPEPVGPRRVYKTNHDETYFMPMGIKTLKNASFNIAIDDDFAQAAAALRRIGLLGKQSIDVKGVKVRPIDVVAAVMPKPVDYVGKVKGDASLVVEVIGEREGRKMKVKTWTMLSHEKAYALYNSSAAGYYVGAGGATAAEMFIDGEIKEKGLLIPEQLATESYIARLRVKGLEINEQVVLL